MKRGGIFSESDLTFRFDKTWRLKKYDTHFYYQIMGSAGLRGVDFLAIREDHLYLMEVKNYCLRQSRQSQSAIYKRLEDPEGLTDQLHEKIVDSLQGIRTIHKVLLRKKLYRILQPSIQSWPDWLKQFNDWWFWTQTSALAEAGDRATFVVWLETEVHYPDYPAPIVEAWKQEIEKRLEAKTGNLPVDIQIANRQQPIFYPHLTVEAEKGLS